jgi:Fic family protein
LVTALSAADRGVARLGALTAPGLSEFGLADGFSIADGFPVLVTRIEAAASCRLAGFETDLPAIFEYEAAYRSDGDPPEGPADAAAYAGALEGASRREGEGIDLDEIEAIHGELFPRAFDDERPVGEFRGGRTWIGPDGPEDARFVPPPPDVMGDSLESLAGFMRSSGSLPPLVRLALIHYQFEVIHPFHDGNGRLGRLLVALLPCRRGLLPRPVLALSPYLLRHAEVYPDLLARVSRGNEVEAWLIFFLDGLAAAAAETERLLEGLRSMREVYHAQVAGERAADRLREVIDLALVRPYINVGQVEAALPGANFKSASRYVDRIEALGILEETTGQARHRVFRAREWVRRLADLL